MCHEVEGEIKEYRSNDFVWQVANHGRYCFRKWVVEGVLRMLLNNRPLRIERQDLIPLSLIILYFKAISTTYLKKTAEGIK